MSRKVENNIYNFEVKGKPKSVEAESMDKALTKIIGKHFWSFTNRSIVYVSSTDKEAPTERMRISTKGVLR